MTYGFWGEEEPDHNTLVTLAICEDVRDPDGHALQDRQNERWAEFLEHNKIVNRNSHARFDAVVHGGINAGSMWWELWQPLNADPMNLINHGTLELHREIKYMDLDFSFPHRNIVLNDVLWMDFHPVQHHGFPLLNAFTMPNPPMYGKDWWWQKGFVRTRILEARYSQPENIFAVKTPEPPPYGHWMPCLELNTKKGE